MGPERKKGRGVLKGRIGAREEKRMQGLRGEEGWSLRGGGEPSCGRLEEWLEGVEGFQKENQVTPPWSLC